MKIQIDLKRWYARGNVELSPNEEYEPMMLTLHGERCCLGFCALSHGVKDRCMLQTSAPDSVREWLEPSDWMLALHGNSFLSHVAIGLNDGLFYEDEDDSIDWSKQPLEVRMGNLISVFLEGGDELEFVP